MTSNWLKKDKSEILEELAEVKAELKALRTERDRTAEVVVLEKKISDLQINHDKLVEDNERKIRETEHKVGLLRVQQEQEVANATREARLEIREGNLAKDEERFAEQIKFEREHFEKSAGQVNDILKDVLSRLPNVEAVFGAKQSGKA